MYRSIADMLSKKYGKVVELVPQVMYPQGIQTPDYLIDGERFDLKSLKSSGKNLIYNMVSKKKKQSPNFIFDITNCPLSEDEIEKQIKDVYASVHTKFIKKMVVVKEGEIILCTIDYAFLFLYNAALYSFVFHPFICNIHRTGIF